MQERVVKSLLPQKSFTLSVDIPTAWIPMDGETGLVLLTKPNSLPPKLLNGNVMVLIWILRMVLAKMSPLLKIWLSLLRN
jgi:hypothetical protein